MNGVLGCFIMAMQFTMILILYVIPSELSCDLIILYNLVKSWINPYSAGSDFSRQNLTSVDVRSWRLKSFSTLLE